ENLHSVWDTGLINELVNSEPDLAMSLRQTAREMHDTSQETVVGWALESHAVARQRVYGALPSDRQLAMPYVDAQRPIVKHQLILAGLRLATVLNRACEPTGKIGPTKGGSAPISSGMGWATARVVGNAAIAARRTI